MPSDQLFSDLTLISKVLRHGNMSRLAGVIDDLEIAVREYLAAKAIADAISDPETLSASDADAISTHMANADRILVELNDAHVKKIR